jgi:hypothetical protein
VEDGKGKVRKVMNAITALLDELRDKVKRHQTKSPGPSLSTWSYDDGILLHAASNTCRPA